MTQWRIKGRVVDGLGRGAAFTSLPWARRQFVDRAGVEPFPGTLNLRIEDASDLEGWSRVSAAALQRIVPPAGQGCEARCLHVRVAGRVPALVVVPEVSGYPSDQVEIVAAIGLRDTLGVQPGDEVEISAAVISEPRAVVFDVDGTLVDSLAGIHEAASRAAAMFGYEVPYEAVRQAMDGGAPLWDLIVPEDRRGDAELVRILRTETMRHWPSVLASTVRVFPGLEDTLRGLRSAGVRLAICTGSRGESFLPLERAGLMEFFEPIVTGRDVKRPKPDPEGLLICLEKLGCERGEAVYVGDSRHDVEAARAAGMAAIGVLTGAADSAALSAAGADRLVAGQHLLTEVLFPR
jgi:phosphoglycolate phosphatase